MKDAVHFVMWLFIGALVVLVITHAAGFATSVNAVGGQLTNDAFLLSGGAAATNSGGKVTPSKAPGSWAVA